MSISDLVGYIIESYIEPYDPPQPPDSFRKLIPADRPEWWRGRRAEYVIARYRGQLTRLSRWKRDDMLAMQVERIRAIRGEEYAEQYRARMEALFAARDAERLAS